MQSHGPPCASDLVIRTSQREAGSARCLRCLSQSSCIHTAPKRHFVLARRCSRVDFSKIHPLPLMTNFKVFALFPVTMAREDHFIPIFRNLEELLRYVDYTLCAPCLLEIQYVSSRPTETALESTETNEVYPKQFQRTTVCTGYT